MDKKEYDRLRYLEKKEEIKARVKKRYEENSESIKAYQKIYNEANKEFVAERQSNYDKQRYLENPEIYKNRNLKSKLNNPESSRKSERLSNWRKYGIICDDMDSVYIHYLNCNRCEYCDEPFKSDYDRCLDHDHSIIDRNNIRGVLCRKCNTLDVLDLDNLDFLTS